MTQVTKCWLLRFYIEFWDQCLEIEHLIMAPTIALTALSAACTFPPLSSVNRRWAPSLWMRLSVAEGLSKVPKVRWPSSRRTKRQSAASDSKAWALNDHMSQITIRGHVPVSVCASASLGILGYYLCVPTITTANSNCIRSWNGRDVITHLHLSHVCLPPCPVPSGIFCRHWAFGGVQYFFSKVISDPSAKIITYFPTNSSLFLNVCTRIDLENFRSNISQLKAGKCLVRISLQ